MGAGGEEFGIALYPKRGSIAAVHRAVAQGRLDRAAAIDSISLTLEDDPPFAVQAIGAWCGLGRVPVMFAMRGGAAAPLEAADVLALALTLQATSRMNGEPGEEYALSSEEERISVKVRVPETEKPKKPVRRKR